MTPDKIGNFALGLLILIGLTYAAHGLGYLYAQWRGHYARNAADNKFYLVNRGFAFFVVPFIAWAWVYGAVIIIHNIGAWTQQFVHGLLY